jgi:adenosylcobinamide kinase/adenosylcobinamide-phosphate guanylyltransferase
MELVLAGSGPASGFPAPGCGCAACAAAAAPGSGAGRRGPARLELPGGWALAADPESDAALLVGPEGHAVRLGPGERLAVGAQPAGWEVWGVDARVLLVRPRGAGGLLWAPQAGPLAEDAVAALRDVAAGLLVIGPAPEPSWTDVGFSVARLRAVGALRARGAGGDVLLVGAGHGSGRAGRVAAALPHWGARMPVDGDLLVLADEQPDRREDGGYRPRRTLLLGGASSGKSSLAELLLAADPGVRYLATGPRADPDADADWARRVRRHQDRRPPWWRTVETGDLPGELAGSADPVLVDSIGSWLTGVLDRVGAWNEEPGWDGRLAGHTDALVAAWRERRGALVAVTDETGLGVVPATAAGRRFRDELGRLNRRLADESEVVALVVAGRWLSDS